MKYFLLSTILLLSCSSFAQKTIKEKDIPFIDGKHYYKGKLLNGKYKVKFSKPNAHFSEIAEYIDGIKEGKAVKLRFNKPEEEGYYNNNIREGEWKKYFYNNGRLETISNYREGIKEGLEINYNTLSSVDSLYYVNGLQHGIQISSHKYDGRTESLYENGTLLSSVSYDRDGDLKEKCEYSGYKSAEKICVKYRKVRQEKDIIIYTDSLFSKKDNQLLKIYLNDSLKYQIKINNNDYKQFITYYKEDKIVMLDEIYFDSYVYSYFNQTELILNQIISSLVYRGFNNLMHSDFRSNFHPFLIDLENPYYIYRLNKDGTYNKRLLYYYHGASDILPGAAEKTIIDKTELPVMDKM